MPGLAQTAEPDHATGVDGEDGQRGVLQGDPQPGLGWELKGPTDEVSNNIRMGNYNLNTVSGLSRLSSVEILPR